MATLLVMYKKPLDAAAFDRHYHEKHIPIAKKLPGLRKYTVTKGPLMTPGGPADVNLVATLEFDDMSAIQAAFRSAEGQAAIADVQTFATGGANMLMSETQTV